MLFDEVPESVKRHVVLRELRRDERLFQQGDTASAIFEVVSGRVRLVRRTIDDHLVALFTARPGDLLAEAALFSATYHCDAVAATASCVRIYPKRAADLGLSREALYRTLAALEADGVIKRSANGIRLKKAPSA